MAQIERQKHEKEEFDNRRKHVLENNEEWTEGEFPGIIPDEAAQEVDNDIE